MEQRRQLSWSGCCISQASALASVSPVSPVGHINHLLVFDIHMSCFPSWFVASVAAVLSLTAWDASPAGCSGACTGLPSQPHLS